MSKSKLAEKAALVVPALGLLTPLQGLGSEVGQPVQAPEPDKVRSTEQSSDSANLSFLNADIEASPAIKEALKDSVALTVDKHGNVVFQTKEKYYQDVQAKLQKGNAPAVVRKGTLRPEFDRANIASPNKPSEETMQAIRNIYQKKAVREALEDAYPIVIQWYGENGQTIKEKYFDDIKDKVVKVSYPALSGGTVNGLPAGTGTQDSTSINGTNFQYDNCNLNPTTSGVNYASPGQGCICHGACHGQCFSLYQPSSLKVFNKHIRVDSVGRDNHDMVLEDGDEYALQGLFNVSQLDQLAQDCILV